MFLIDWLFPIKCYGCGKSQVYFCSVCLDKYQRLKKQSSGKLSPLKKIISLYPYKTPFDQMLKDYKYHQVRGLKKSLSVLLIEGLKTTKWFDYWNKNSFVFVPVPLHPLKELNRGFNQSETILIDVCQELGLVCKTDWVKRVKWTKSQTKLVLSTRQKNVEQAFEVNDDKIIPGSNLVIFDDVMTTGSTIVACARAFARSSVKAIHGLTMFRRL